MSTEKNIGIIGGTIWGNRGAESMLVTTIHQVREYFPEANFFVYSYYPAKDRILVSDPQIQILDGRPLQLGLLHLPLSVIYALLRRLPGFRNIKIPNPGLEKLKRCSVLLDIGGITFTDGRELFLLYNVCSILPAMVLEIPVIKLAQALGPFKNPVNRLFSKLLLPGCKHIFARGESTAKHLIELGLSDSQWTLSSDIAFLFNEEASLSDENPQKTSITIDRINAYVAANYPMVAISPSSLVFKKCQSQDIDYIGAIINVLRSAPKDTRFILLPNATRESVESTRNNDIIVIQKILQRLGKLNDASIQDMVIPIDFDLNTAGIREILKFVDINITSRFHSMIASLSLGLPTIVLGWSHKYQEILAEFECQDYVLDYRDIDEDLCGILNTLLDDSDRVRKKIRNHLKDIQEKSKLQFEYIHKVLS